MKLCILVKDPSSHGGTDADRQYWIDVGIRGRFVIFSTIFQAVNSVVGVDVSSRKYSYSQQFSFFYQEILFLASKLEVENYCEVIKQLPMPSIGITHLTTFLELTLGIFNCWHAHFWATLPSSVLLLIWPTTGYWSIFLIWIFFRKIQIMAHVSCSQCLLHLDWANASYMSYLYNGGLFNGLSTNFLEKKLHFLKVPNAITGLRNYLWLQTPLYTVHALDTFRVRVVFWLSLVCSFSSSYLGSTNLVLSKWSRAKLRLSKWDVAIRFPERDSWWEIWWNPISLFEIHICLDFCFVVLLSFYF